MTEKEDNTKEENKLPSADDAIVLFATIADTTWRLFVPTLGGVGFGLWIDNTYDTKPLATIIGVCCGTILSLYLVYRQLQGVKPKQ